MTGLPPSPWQTRNATVRAITPEVPEVRTYDLDLHGANYSFRPGQFNMLYVPGVGEVAISVSSDPAVPHQLRHTIRAVGNVTRAMTRLAVGDTLGLRGPFGTAWPVETVRGDDVVIVAGGLGLAPLRPVIYHLIRHRHDYGRVAVLYGARTPADLLYAHEYDWWQAAELDVHISVDVATPNWRGAIGFVTTLLAQLPVKPTRTAVFTCGPEVMMRFVASGACQRGVPAERIFVSLERNMNCAVALCGHCQFGPSFVCHDGPVFSYDRVGRLLWVENL
ncbi:MAG: FAD/NAD(P)-binding protein [Gemmataceae bacterium]|nr:FAD/NAD(P)-binding protein [Gemmata sp.]MDW8196847.1 FAD/NAD(P)-binding protein [Gemmataceae bacterium]